LFLYDHLRLRRYDLCLISSISSLEEMIGNLGFDWCLSEGYV
jgi:hypothetical protein